MSSDDMRDEFDFSKAERGKFLENAVIAIVLRRCSLSRLAIATPNNCHSV